MNKFLSALLLGGLISCQQTSTEVFKDDYASKVEIPMAGNAYLTEGKGAKITKKGLREWTADEAVISVYFKTENPQKAYLQLLMEDTEGPAELTVKVGDEQKTIPIPAEGSDTLNLGLFDLPGGYAKVDLQGTERSSSEFASINSLIVNSPSEEEITFVRDNESNRFYWGRRGPSVHLSYALPKDKDFKWFYNEITVPKGEDPNGSYYMANGFGEGYFGIQVNGDDERRILFSVWSPFHTDNPDEIPEDQKIKLLKKGEEVNTGEFGNEGSGGQSFRRYKWITGNTYQFLNAVEPDGKGNTIYTAYFYAPEIGEWQLIASFLRPQTDTWYKRPHSFLENFNDKNGYIGRKAHYGNQWAQDTDGNWHELTEARFTGDDIATRGYRTDYAGGEENGQFFLQNGGYFAPAVPLNSEYTREKTNKTPQIDFDALP
ncbi:hypothetical protein GCM10007049_21110 [Echinicola pacifica]|uniref:DUF5077 domain-containing protein n=1 Tax=Echinicola pacifica TaxID=346377 RepID=A0A918PYV8_9BACT|nr:DUF3472 domain-containing protein [Echinicola pacifica]GGZ27980.1 hypothetical protein GCM10007049_21110 [Echinicola pacifica]